MGKTCNFATLKLKLKVPSSSQDIGNEIIWNNKFICIDKKSIYRRDLVNLGFLKIGDLFSANANPLRTNPEQSFFIMSIVNSISPQWRQLQSLVSLLL